MIPVGFVGFIGGFAAHGVTDGALEFRFIECAAAAFTFFQARLAQTFFEFTVFDLTHGDFAPRGENHRGQAEAAAFKFNRENVVGCGDVGETVGGAEVDAEGIHSFFR